MFGLFSRSHMNAGQDGFRDASSNTQATFGGQWKARSVSRLRSIDHTICSLPCKSGIGSARLQLSCSPCLADLYAAPIKAAGADFAA